jgi:hypothetical protein
METDDFGKVKTGPVAGFIFLLDFRWWNVSRIDCARWP